MTTDTPLLCAAEVFWWDGQYEGACGLPADHEGPHFDGLFWYGDDWRRCSPPDWYGLRLAWRARTSPRQREQLEAPAVPVMVVAETPHRCIRGARCPGREKISDTTVGAWINPEFGLCLSCERTVEDAIGELPRDYVELAVALGRIGPGGEELVSGSRELPVPIRLSVEALMARIWDETQCWAELVAERMRIDWDTQESRGSRRGAVVERAASLLSNSVSALLALRDVEMVTTGVVPGGEDARMYVARDGAEGALTLLDLHHRARRFAGLTRIVMRLKVPCPHCKQELLTQAAGSDLVKCGNDRCGLVMTWANYETWCELAARRKESA